MESLAVLLAVVTVVLFLLVVIALPYGASGKWALGWGFGITLVICSLLSGIIWNLPPFNGKMEGFLHTWLGVDYTSTLPLPSDPRLQPPEVTKVKIEVVKSGKALSYEGDVPPGFWFTVQPEIEVKQGRCLLPKEKYAIPAGAKKVLVYFVNKAGQAVSVAAEVDVK